MQEEDFLLSPPEEAKKTTAVSGGLEACNHGCIGCDMLSAPNYSPHAVIRRGGCPVQSVPSPP